MSWSKELLRKQQRLRGLRTTPESWAEHRQELVKKLTLNNRSKWCELCQGKGTRKISWPLGLPVRDVICCDCQGKGHINNG